MSEELKRLENAFRKQEELEPAKGAKAEAMRLAMQAFEEEKTSLGTQGNELDERLNQQGNEKKPLFDWRKRMNTLNSKFGYTLAGGASLAVLAFVMVSGNVSQFTTFDDAQPTLSNVGEESAKDDASARKDALLDQEEVRTQSEPAAKTEVSKVPAADAAEPLADVASGDERQETDAAAPAENEIAETATQLPAKPELKKQGSSNRVRTQLLPNRTREAVGQNSGAVSGLVAKRESFAKIAPQPAPVDLVAPQYQDQGRDKFAEIETNPVKVVTEQPVSTFSVDVDTASYAFHASIAQ